jgi:hypothetical protein
MMTSSSTFFLTNPALRSYTGWRRRRVNRGVYRMEEKVG